MLQRRQNLRKDRKIVDSKGGKMAGSDVRQVHREVRPRVDITCHNARRGIKTIDSPVGRSRCQEFRESSRIRKERGEIQRSDSDGRRSERQKEKT